jgi:hypothetical protein
VSSAQPEQTSDALGAQSKNRQVGGGGEHLLGESVCEDPTLQECVAEAGEAYEGLRVLDRFRTASRGLFALVPPWATTCSVSPVHRS